MHIISRDQQNVILIEVIDATNDSVVQSDRHIGQCT